MINFHNEHHEWAPPEAPLWVSSFGFPQKSARSLFPRKLSCFCLPVCSPSPLPALVAPPPSHLASQQPFLLCPSPPPHWLLLTSDPSSLASSSFLERAPCLWLLPGVFMLASLHKLLADVCLLLKPHLQPERGEDFFIFIFFKDL